MRLFLISFPINRNLDPPTQLSKNGKKCSNILVWLFAHHTTHHPLHCCWIACHQSHDSECCRSKMCTKGRWGVNYPQNIFIWFHGFNLSICFGTSRPMDLEKVLISYLNPRAAARPSQNTNSRCSSMHSM